MKQQEQCSRLSDFDLVTRFARTRDEDAFSELVRRHCRLVLGVCKRILKDDQEAEDALQTTFLVLARDVAKIRRRQSIASWLYGVAYRTALKSAARRSRRPEVSRGDMSMTADRALADVTSYHDQRLLDEELNRLPEKYRAALVMHYLQGKTLREVADELDLTPTAVKGRLQRGRKQLRLRLAMRGVGLSLALVAIEASRKSLEAAHLQPFISSVVSETLNLTSGHAMPPPPSGWDLAGKETSIMQTASNALIAVVMLAALVGGLAWQTPDRPLMAQTPLATVQTADPETDVPLPVQSSPTFLALAGSQAEDAKPGDSSSATVIKYGDGQPDGKKSLGGSGEMSRFQLPRAEAKVRGIRIHAARYGYPKPPKEDVLIYLLDAEGEEVLHTQTAPYSLFKRGDSKWVTVRFKRPLAVSETFWVVLDFKAERTKGVYVSYDTSTDGENSRTGLPGKESRETGFDGDWMIQVLLARQ